jgi:hypothetical protein
MLRVCSSYNPGICNHGSQTRLWLQGTKALAVLAATGTAYASRGVPALGHEINMHNEGKDIDSRVCSDGERRQNEPSFPAKFTFRRQVSVAVSIASTRSTTSIVSYMRARGVFNFFRSTDVIFEDIESRNSTFNAARRYSALRR